MVDLLEAGMWSLLARTHHNFLRSVRGQQNQRMTKIDACALGVFHRAFVEYLIKQLQHIGMRFFHFIK